MALIPDEPVLDRDQAVRVEQDVLEFVLAELQAMPLYLWIPYNCALVCFNVLAVCRYGSTFLGLDQERQRAYVQSWTGSGMRLKRDMIRLIRSCVLLSYLDHPLVLARLEQEQPGAGHDQR